jgi:hypothetical protein
MQFMLILRARHLRNREKLGLHLLLLDKKRRNAYKTYDKSEMEFTKSINDSIPSPSFAEKVAKADRVL